MAFTIIGLGEVLWDMLPTGRQMGGAPANFACLARALGADVSLISRVGNDELGRETLDSLKRAWVNVQAVGRASPRPFPSRSQTTVSPSPPSTRPALVLAEKGGAEPVAVHEALRGGFADSRILTEHGQRMLSRDFKLGGTVNIGSRI